MAKNWSNVTVVSAVPSQLPFLISSPPLKSPTTSWSSSLSLSTPRSRITSSKHRSAVSKPGSLTAAMFVSSRLSTKSKRYASLDDDSGISSSLSGEGSEDSVDWIAAIFPFLFPAIGGALFGYDIGATSGALISLTSPELSGTAWYSLTPFQTGIVVSGSLYGALIGSILAFKISDGLGRRKELLVAAALYILGSVGTYFANSLNLLLVGRLIYGLGIGLAMHGAPLYIAETSPPQIRGTLVSLKEAFIVLGILLGYLVGNAEIGAVGGWRFMYGFAAPVAVIMGLGMGWLPPSPRWLLLRAVQGKETLQAAKRHATQALSRLRNGRISSDILEEQVERSLESIQSSNVKEEPTFSEVFEGSSLKALKVGAGLVFFQQVTGQPSVLYYAASILQSAGFSAAADATRVSIVIGVFKLLLTGVAILKVDDLGRRPLLIGGVGGIVLSLFLLAGYYSIGQGYPVLAVISLLLYVSCYQISFGPISWLMVSEIFPLRTRGRALSIAVLVNFASNALVTLLFAPIQNFLGASMTFVTFGVIGVISLLFIMSSVPETKGLTLEEIEAKISKV
ncbi:hypothetical protein KP509_09G033900 [Ceratopteris richardii]|uniref:Major facilitator superfamily (MFS) profile domain-containing protein n=1 Tax=Ceratopteris richardii TaxID=49495 RepID=A0A8T2U9I4_CERRI|nr:hypothetical protein KP509_09G033900 [Ceratopteris richardii]KAH7429179.1 hypothetical protein KP509_09G033900 [Ceratopteris richardii]